MNFGRDEILVVSYKCCFVARSSKGRIRPGQNRSGFPVEERTVDRIQIYIGERYDFLVDVGNTGVYNITADMHRASNVRYLGVSGRALLNVTYGTSPSVDSLTTSTLKVLGCPFRIFPQRPDLECIPVADLVAINDRLDPSDMKFSNEQENGQRRQTFFLNFVLTETGLQTINYVHFKLPSVSAISEPNEIVQCPRNPIGNLCIHSLELHKNANITIVLVNIGTGAGNTHPVHMHGHTFDVIKMGLPTVYENGTFVHNTDIKCESGTINDESNWPFLVYRRNMCSAPISGDVTSVKRFLIY